MIDFNKGYTIHGMFLGPLKKIEDSIKAEAHSGKNSYFDYQPGNGTRYRVLFSRVPDLDPNSPDNDIVMNVINFGRSMIIPPTKMNTIGQLDYMYEKMGNLNLADCFALMQLVSHYVDSEDEK